LHLGVYYFIYQFLAGQESVPKLNPNNANLHNDNRKRMLPEKDDSDEDLDILFFGSSTTKPNPNNILAKDPPNKTNNNIKPQFGGNKRKSKILDDEEDEGPNLDDYSFKF
jgi:hypothetical protein